MTDDLQELVNSAVSAVQAGPSRRALETLASMAQLEPSYLLPELLHQLEEAAITANMSSLSATELIPDLTIVPRIIKAVQEDDFDLLQSTIEGGYSGLVVTLVSIIAVLHDSVKH